MSSLRFADAVLMTPMQNHYYIYSQPRNNFYHVIMDRAGPSARNNQFSDIPSVLDEKLLSRARANARKSENSNMYEAIASVLSEDYEQGRRKKCIL